MIINGIDCEEVTKEHIMKNIREIPELDALYSEKHRLLIIVSGDHTLKLLDLYQIIPENENGMFWENKDKDYVYGKLKKVKMQEILERSGGTKQ